MPPEHVAVVLGTGTGVGKTWATAAVARRLRGGGVDVAVRKPVQSFAACDVETDARVLASATGERPSEVCPQHRSYPIAMAPPIAAAFLGRPPFTVAELVEEVTWPPGFEVGLVETAGGPRSPIADDGDSLDLAAALEPGRAVLVAPSGLGAINDVRLAGDAVVARGLSLVVFLNRFRADDVADRNRQRLLRDGYELVTTIDELAARLAPLGPLSPRGAGQR